MDHPLTSHEGAIVRLAADGLSPDEIAARLHVHRETVDMHVRSIYGKLGIRDAEALKHWVSWTGLARS